MIINNTVNYHMFDKYEKIKKTGLRIFGVRDLAIILGLEIPSSRVIANRLAKKGIIRRLKKDLYILTGVEIADFEIANRLIYPSYVSFESALNYWGITTQIPEVVTSASYRSKKITINDKEFIYSRISEEIFHFGIIREENFFVARPEKALLDMIYYTSINKRSILFDELFLSALNRKIFYTWLKHYPLKTRLLAKEKLWT